MLLLFAQCIAIILQLVAMSAATRLTKATKYNASWIFFIIAIIIITLQRGEEFIHSLNAEFDLGLSLKIPHSIYIWGGVIVSVCIAGALFLIRRLIIFIEDSELKRHNAQEQTLNSVIAAEERQRQRLAKELHDGLGPLLSTAQMSISAIRTSDQTQKEIIANAEQAIALALKSLKSTSGALSSHVLENFGLSRALSNVVKSNLYNGIEIKFYTNIGSRRFNPAHELAIYRVATELISNSFKHSKATLITIDLVWTGVKIEFVYSDNGVGFNPEIESIGMGLRNIRSRIESIKGKIEITSSPNNGIKVLTNFASNQIQ